MEHVILGIFEIYEKLLNLKFKENKDYVQWHEDVKLYEVLENDVIVGYFYTDLYPRYYNN